MTIETDHSARAVPTDMARESVDRALAAIASAIGAEKFEVEDVSEFADPFGVPGEDSNLPCGVVSPTSVEDVQAIVRIANEHGLPLWPIGRGKNNGYGGGAPRLRGALMLSFRSMNKVLEINEELGYA